jgi:hypothetical protein
MPLQLTGEAKQGEMIFYAVLPAHLTGGLSDPTLAFTPGALLRSSGRVIDALNIDDVRWPLAGVKVTRRAWTGGCRPFSVPMKTRWVILFYTLTARRVIFCQTMGCGNGVTGGRVILPL